MRMYSFILLDRTDFVRIPQRADIRMGILRQRREKTPKDQGFFGGCMSLSGGGDGRGPGMGDLVDIARILQIHNVSPGSHPHTDPAISGQSESRRVSEDQQ